MEAAHQMRVTSHSSVAMFVPSWQGAHWSQGRPVRPCRRGAGAHLDDLAKHDSGVTVQERDAGQTLAVLEGVHDQRLAGLEHQLSHLVGLEGVGLLELLATRLLANLYTEHPESVTGTQSSPEAADSLKERLHTMLCMMFASNAVERNDQGCSCDEPGPGPGAVAPPSEKKTSNCATVHTIPTCSEVCMRLVLVD